MCIALVLLPYGCPSLSPDDRIIRLPLLKTGKRQGACLSVAPLPFILLQVAIANGHIVHSQGLDHFAVERLAPIKHNLAAHKLMKIERLVDLVVGLENNGTYLILLPGWKRRIP